jgi:hypothetical protein
MCRTHLLTLTLISSLLLQGCELNPIKADGDDLKDANACPNSTEGRNDASPQSSLCNAINLADGYRRAYTKRAGVILGTREGLGYAFVGASTLALYYAATPQPMRTNAEGVSVASSNYAQRVRRMGALGGGAYAVGQWGSPKARDLVYLDGARAMACAVLKASPAIAALKDYSQLTSDLGELHSAISTVDFQLKQPKVANRDDADALLVDARNLADEADRLLGEADSAGHQLRARVQLIDIEVRRRRVVDSPSFESLVSLSASLPGVARSMGSDLSAVPPPDSDKATPLHGKLAQEAEKSDETTINLDALRSAFNSLQPRLVALARVRSAVDSVEDCTVGGGASFSFAPNVTNASFAVNDRYTVVVTDLVGHPSASVAGGQTGAVKLNPIEITGKGQEYRVVVTGETATGTGDKPVLSIRSASGLSGADISLTVTGLAAQNTETREEPPVQAALPDPAACTATGTDDPISACAFDAIFIKEPHNILAVQCLVGASADCRMGKNTREQIAVYRKSLQPPVGNHVDTTLATAANPLLTEIKRDLSKYACPTRSGTTIVCPDLTP